MNRVKRLAMRIAATAFATLSLAQTPAVGWLTISRDDFCVTEGAIGKSGDRLRVSVPKMRAYVTRPTGRSVEVRFKYLGATSQDTPLGSGIMRRQFGLKLHAQDACNLVYVMWRIEPESKVVVSVKRNPTQHTSAECSNRGYQNIKPRKASPAPRVVTGQSHTLRAEMRGEELRVFVDNRPAWEGSMGSDAASLEGPAGIRSDNAQIEFELLALKSSGSAKACKTGESD